MTLARPLFPALAPVALALSLTALPAGPAAATAATPTTRAADPSPHPTDAWIASMEARYNAQPELKSQRGSGWKPYERIRWYVDKLRTDGRIPDPATVQAAWDESSRRRSAPARRAAVWFENGPFERSGRILDIAFNATATTVYVASASGGLWKSSLPFFTWTALTDGLASPAVGAVTVDPNDENVIVIATGEANFNAYAVDGIGILRSTDGGLTWQPTNIGFPRGSATGFHFVRFSPTVPGLVFAGGYSQLLGTPLFYRSVDGGATWAADASITQQPFECRFGYDPLKVYVAVGNPFTGGAQVLSSTDGGASWSGSTGLPANAGRVAMDVFRNDNGEDIVYTHCATNAAGGYATAGIYRSSDGGATFTAQNTSINMAGMQGWYDLTVSVHPWAPDTVLAGGIRLWRSTDGGVTFAETGTGPDPLGDGSNLHVDNQVVEWSSFPEVWTGTDGGIWYSTDDGQFWGSAGYGLGTYQFYDICVAAYQPDIVAGGTQDNGTPARVWFGTWAPSQPEFGDGMVCHIDPSGNGKWYGESQYGALLRSTNHGDSWYPIVNGITGTGRWLAPLAMDPANTAILLTETSDGIFHTTDSGSNWSRVALHRAVWIDIATPPSIVWTVNDDGSSPRVSHGGGASGTWAGTSPFGLAPGGPATRVLGDPGDSNSVYVTFGGYGAGAHVVASTDGGGTWTDVTGDLPNIPVFCMIIDPVTDEWFLGTLDGVWSSLDGGTGWLPVGMLPAVPVFDLEIRTTTPRKLVAGTYGRGVWEMELPGGGVDAGDPVAGPPRRLMLDTPAPNPVRDATTIRFAARHSGNVSVQVYDVTGRRVSDLGSAPGDGRIRTVPWIPADVPAGTYFVVLQAGEERVSRKVVVVR